MTIQLLIALGVTLLGVLRPGTNVVIKDQPPPRAAPTDTGVWFVVGLSEKGPATPTLIQSMTEYATLYGQRVSYGLLYDALDVYFREGGRRAYVMRVVGPAAVKATRNLNDGVAAVSLVATAKNAGDWGNLIKVGVLAGTQGGTFQIQVLDANNVLLEQSGDLVTQADAVNWSLTSTFVNLALGASVNPPVPVAAAALAGGTDDRASITDTHWANALDLFTKDLGPGQVSYPGRTTLTAQQQLLAHAQPHDRVALIDLPDSALRSTLVAAAVALRGASARFAAAFSPWAQVPGITPGTIRTVPYSAVQAGLIARNDVSLSANVPAAGDRGVSRYAIGLSQNPWTDTDRGALNDAGVNVAVNLFGGIRTYGYRTLVNKDTDSNWIDFGNSRLVMEIAARGDAIMQTHVFDQIDGQGHLFSTIDGELTAMLNDFYVDDSLYGATPEEAYSVDTSDSVNTPQTIANHEIHATIGMRPSPMGEMVELDLVKVAVTDSIQ